jgi:hypothetical protein
MCKDPSKFMAEEQAGGFSCSLHSGLATGGLAQRNIAWADANACETVKTLKNGEVYTGMTAFGPKCCGAAPWELNTVNCFGDDETDTGSLCKVATDFSGTKTSSAGWDCNTGLYFLKEGLFKSGKKLIDSDACESLKTASRSGGSPGELLTWIQDGYFDACCGGERAKVRCSDEASGADSGDSGSSDGSSAAAPSDGLSAASGAATICSSISAAMIALVLLSCSVLLHSF